MSRWVTDPYNDPWSLQLRFISTVTSTSCSMIFSRSVRRADSSACAWARACLSSAILAGLGGTATPSGSR